ncbi:MAG: hypothetical protein KDB27_20100 [Planctomycetales bacterium]|nr:hypothetical protein [Planctomycetales bacterium]
MCVNRPWLCVGLLVSLFFACTPVASADELVGLWRFDNADNLGLDSSTVGNNLVVDGGVSFDAGGRFGGAGDFDGVDGMLIPTADFPQSIPLGNDPYTIATWMRPIAPLNESGYPAGMIGWGSYGDARSVNAFRIFNDNGFRHYWWGADLDASDSDVDLLDVDLDDGEWHHAVALYDGEVRALYLNGELLAEDFPGDNDAQAEDFAVGRTCSEGGARPWCGPGEFFVGQLDDVAIFDFALDENQIVAIMNGDFSEFVETDPLAPLDNGTLTNPDERANYVHDVLNTWVGDANLDGEFNSGDLVAVFTTGEYEDRIEGNSNWRSGDWNGDGDFGSGDFVAAFADGGYELGPRPPIAAVPEPSSGILLVIGVIALGRWRRLA